MHKRPLAVIIIACVYILTGAAGLVRSLSEGEVRHPLQSDAIWPGLLSLAAIVGGAYLLRGRNWARWLVLAWMAVHAILGAFHTLSQFAIHCLFLAILAYFLLRAEAARYFRPAGT